MRFQYGTPPRLTRTLDVQLKAVEGHWVIEKLEPPPAGKP